MTLHHVAQQILEMPGHGPHETYRQRVAWLIAENERLHELVETGGYQLLDEWVALMEARKTGESRKIFGSFGLVIHPVDESGKVQ